VQFYAYLTSLVDQEIMKVLQALDHNHSTEKTLIVRISDHGDMAMAHGMQRQKMYNVYRETLNVPMIFSNPRAFPKAQTTQALAGLIDLMPTMADIAGVISDDWTFQGQSLKPVLENPGAEVQDYVHYTYDDDYVTTPNPQDMGPRTFAVSWKKIGNTRSTSIRITARRPSLRCMICAMTKRRNGISRTVGMQLKHRKSSACGSTAALPMSWKSLAPNRTPWSGRPAMLLAQWIDSAW